MESISRTGQASGGNRTELSEYWWYCERVQFFFCFVCTSCLASDFFTPLRQAQSMPSPCFGDFFSCFRECDVCRAHAPFSDSQPRAQSLSQSSAKVPLPRKARPCALSFFAGLRGSLCAIRSFFFFFVATKSSRGRFVYIFSALPLGFFLWVLLLRLVSSFALPFVCSFWCLSLFWVILYPQT
jgi:hypothetical protein